MGKPIGRKYNHLYPKERQLLQKIKSGLTPQQATREVYNTKGNENAIVSRVFRRERFLKAYEEAGLTATELIKSITDGTKANKAMLYRGTPTEFGPDWFVRLAFLKLILKAQGILEENQEEQRPDVEPLIIGAVKITQNTINLNQDTKSDSEPLTVDGEITPVPIQAT
jgi:hypothetical protein